MRRILKHYGLSLLPICLVSGCADPDAAACEKYLRSYLVSPSSYKQVSVTRVDRSLSKEELRERLRKASFAEQELLRLTKPGIRTLLIEYDADNAFGAKLRQTGLCKFDLVDGKVNSGIALESAVNLSRGPALDGGIKPCCIVRDMH